MQIIRFWWRDMSVPTTFVNFINKLKIEEIKLWDYLHRLGKAKMQKND
jgi:hypothetical protein